MDSNYLINPFIRIAGYKSLLIGFAGLLLVSFISYITGTHFNGLLFVGFAKDSKFVYYFLEHIISWITIFTFLFLSGIILSKTKFRLIDVLGTTLLARLPLIIAPILRLLPYFQSFVFQSWEMYFIYGAYLLSAFWTIVLLFNAFKISCNLKNERLIISFAVSIILSEIITRLIINSITFKI